jgi:hypothetical protein
LFAPRTGALDAEAGACPPSLSGIESGDVKLPVNLVLVESRT